MSSLDEFLGKDAVASLPSFWKEDVMSRKQLVCLWPELEGGVREKLLKHVLPDMYFWRMIKGYRDFMEEHQDTFVFQTGAGIRRLSD
ncbi:MAG: hypothetical protein R6U17_04235 [Thermoplasmata archaeon]